MYNETITYYAKNPPNKKIPSEYDIEFWEENRTCGDDVKVYIKFSSHGWEKENDSISQWGFIWDTAIITTACASIFWESILWMSLKEVLKCNYWYIVELIGEGVSEKRQKAAVLWLLTTRNAIHQYIGDGIHDTFEDVISKK